MIDKGKGSEPADTSYILGEIKGTVKAIDEKLKVQNGAINGLRESINGFSDRIANLPCEIHAERINNIAKTVAKGTETETQERRDKRQSRKELFIAFAAALITGAFTLFGIWLSQSAPHP